MRYYKDGKNQIYAVENSAEGQPHLPPEGAMEIRREDVVAASAERMQPDFEKYAKMRLTVLRQAREVVLNRIMGIMVSDAQAKEPMKSACLSARLALLQLPQKPDLLAAKTAAELDASIEKHQADLRAASPDYLDKVFKGIQL